MKVKTHLRKIPPLKGGFACGTGLRIKEAKKKEPQA